MMFAIYCVKRLFGRLFVDFFLGGGRGSCYV